MPKTGRHPEKNILFIPENPCFKANQSASGSTAMLAKAHQGFDKAVDLCYRPQPFARELSRCKLFKYSSV